MKIEELLGEHLPPPWNYGVTRDGRVFFVNEKSCENSWLHPVTRQPVQTGHRTNEELPQGWEYAYTIEGIPYFIDHNNQRSTFQHPLTGEQYAIPWSPAQTVQQQQQQYQQPGQQEPRQQGQQQPSQPHPQYQRVLESPPAPETSEPQPQPFVRQKSDRKRQSTKRKNKSRVVKGIPEPKRDFNAKVSQKGWLYKQEGGGLKSWKKRFIVLSDDFCLFFYKDSSEQECVGAISLPSYNINPCLHESNINKKYAFKAEHQNLKTHYFAADNDGDMRTWMNALSLASIAQTDSKNSRKDPETDKDAGFFSESRSPTDNMKRGSANQLFPPQQPPPPQSHGYQRNQNPHYAPDRSDSYSQGSGSNRSAMNSSGNNPTRETGYHGYQPPPSATQSPQVEMRGGGHNHSYSNSEARSSGGIHDPFFVQSPPDEGYNMEAYDPTRQIQNRQDPRDPRDSRYVRPDQTRENTDPRMAPRDPTERLAPEFRGDPRGDSSHYEVSSDQRHQKQPTGGYTTQQNQRLHQRDQRQQQKDQRHPHYDDQRHGPPDRAYNQRDEGYKTTTTTNPSLQKHMYNNPPSQPTGGSSTHLYNHQNNNQNQEGLAGSTRYGNQRPADGYGSRTGSQQPLPTGSSQQPLDPRHSNQSSVVSQSQQGGFSYPHSGGPQQNGRGGEPTMMARQSNPESTTASTKSSISPRGDLYSRDTAAGRPRNHLQPPTGQTTQRISPQRGDQMYSERAVDVPRRDSSVSGSEGYHDNHQIRSRADPRHPQYEQRKDVPYDPRQHQSHDQKRSPDPRFQQSYEPRQPQPYRQNQHGGHEARAQQQQLQQQGDNRSYQSSQRETLVTKGYAQPFPPNSQMTSDPRQRPSQHMHRDPSSTSMSSTHSGAPGSYGQSPHNSGQDSREMAASRGGTPREDSGVNMGRSGLGEGGGAKYFEPLVIDTSPVHEPSGDIQASGTPLLKAEARPAQVPPMPQFVHDLAESQTPHTRSDMLTSMETAIIRKEREPLVFQYPEVKVAHREPIIKPLQHKQQVVNSSSRNSQRYSAASAASDFSLTPPPLPLRTHRPPPSSSTSHLSASLYNNHNNPITKPSSGSSSTGSDVRDGNSLLSHIQVMVTAESSMAESSSRRGDDVFEDTQRINVHQHPKKTISSVSNQSVPELPPRFDIQLKGNNSSYAQRVTLSNHRDAHARRMQLLRDIRREHGLLDSTGHANHQMPPPPLPASTTSHPRAGKPPPPAQYKVAPVSFINEKPEYQRSHPPHQHHRSASLEDDEEIYLTIDDENTQTYTSLSYTLPETFDTEDELAAEGPWYRSSESYSEDDVPPTHQSRPHNFPQGSSINTEPYPTVSRMPADQRHQQFNQQQGQPVHQPQPGLSYRQPYNQPVSQPNQFLGKPSPHEQTATRKKSPYAERKAYDTGVSRYGDSYERSPDSTNYRHTDQRYDRQSAMGSQVPAVLPPMPDRPPPRRLTSLEQSPVRDRNTNFKATKNSRVEKTAAQELKDLKRRSVGYSREMESKEEQRLNKHIAASFKRLSLGSDLTRRFQEEESDLQGYALDQDYRDGRKSLDLEVENSTIINDIGKAYGGQRMVSTPNNNEGYPGQDGLLKGGVRTTNQSQGFRGFLDGATNFSKDPDYGYHSSRDYTDTDQVAVVDMQDNDDTLNSSKGLMEDIDHEVASIKSKMSSLKNLLDAETKRFSPITVDTPQTGAGDAIPDAYPEGHRARSVHQPWNFGMTRNLQDGGGQREAEQAKAERNSVGKDEPSNYQSEHERHRSYDDTLTAQGQVNGPSKQQLSLGNVTHSRQRSYDRYPTTSNGDLNLHSHERQRSYDLYIKPGEHSRQKSFDSSITASINTPQQVVHQKQVSFDKFHPHSKDYFKPPVSDRQASFTSSGSSSRQVKPRPSDHGRMMYGPGDGGRQFEQQAASTMSSSQQSSLRNVSGSANRSDTPDLIPRPTKKQPSNYIPGHHQRSSSLEHQNQYSPVNKAHNMGTEHRGISSNPRQSSFTQEGKTWKSLQGSQDFNTKTTEVIEWKETRPGLFSPSKDDSILAERSRSEKARRNMIQLESRPKSYAEGLKPPLTKLEKLQLENKISRSLGDINLQDLEKESHEIQDRDGIQREGYNPEWDVIKNALKDRDIPHDLGPPSTLGHGYTADPSSSSSGSALPYKSPSMGRRPQPPPVQQQQQDLGYKIGAIKEDPDMPDSQVLEARALTHIQPALNTQRLRLSICAGDLIGKSHEELVLLLIQLRRAQSRLEGEKSYFKGRVEDAKLRQGSFSGQQPYEDSAQHYQDLRRQSEDVDKQLEVHKPLVNLVDNLVTMGSLYGGNNLMMASQYKKHKLRPDQYTAPKEMIEFSRRHQEERLVKEQEEELRKLTEEEIQLEEKLQQLFELDRRLQEKSFHVSSLQENKEHLEKAFDSVRKQEEWETDPREHRRLTQQKSGIEQELTRTRQQLADSSRDLEETAAENAKVEHEVILLRKTVYGADKSSPTLAPDNMKARAKLERELDKITSVMEGLNKQGAKLQEVMNSLGSEHTDKASHPESPSKNIMSTYYITDLDTMTSEDISRSSPEKHTTDRVDSFKEPPEVQRSVRDGPFKLHVSQTNMYKPSVSPLERAQKLDVNQNTVARPNDNVDNNKVKESRQYSSVQSQGRPVPQDGVYTAKKIYVQSPSPNRRQIQTEAQVSVDRLDSSSSDVAQYSPMDINEADDNTKRFYGILPKERPKSQTLRDVKKREFQRKSRDRGRPEDGVENESDTDNRDYRKRSQSLPRRVSDPWGQQSQRGDPGTKSFDDLVRRPRRKLDPERRKSAAERLFPPGAISQQRAVSAVNLNSEDRVKSISSIFTPRPFGTPNKNSTAAASIRPVRMQSNPQLSTGPNTWQKEATQQQQQLHPPVMVSSVKQPSPLMSSPPREGEPRDVPDLSKPQVTFAPRQSYNAPQKPSPLTVATVHPVQNNPMYRETDHLHHNSEGVKMTNTTTNNNAGFMQQFNSWKQSKHNPTATVRPLPNSPSNQKKSRSALKNQRGNPRRQTISSSQPAWFESPSRKEDGVQSAAGDLISGGKHDKGRGLVRSGSLQEVNFDKDTIDRMVLYTPDKVEIPERYIPDSDDESITEDERLLRQEKGDKMRKMLVEQSLQDWQEVDINGKHGSNLHQSLNQEKRRREQLLDIRHALAREVTQRSKEVAVNRMKAMSATNVNGGDWEAEPYGGDSQYDRQQQALPYSVRQDDRQQQAPPYAVRQDHGFYA